MSQLQATLLVVDDNEVNRKILRRHLEQSGYQVVEAEDGHAALSCIKASEVDLIVLDIVMPGLSGLDVLTAVRRRYTPRELPVIMATSVDGEDDMVQAFDLGANDYIQKPFSLPVVTARIRALLRDRGERVERTVRPLSLRDLEPGTLLDGKYRLDELLGAGHHGVVYRATQLGLDRPVAVKLLQMGIQGEETMLARFRQEGISGARLQHPNAVAVLDFGVTSDHLAFLAMELLEGHSLDDELQRDGRLSPRRAAEILIPACDALAEAHALGIVHRDLKPENIFIHRAARHEIVKVLDFGVAKLIGEVALENDLTLEGLAGTPAYLAPERVSDEAYDGRADVYSLGVVLYEVLSGHLPYDTSHGSPLRMVMQHVGETPRPLREVVPHLPAAVSELVERAMTKDPATRPTAVQLRDLLESVVEIEMQEGPRVEAVEPRCQVG